MIKEGNKKGFIIGLTAGIIIVMLIFVVLFATGTISIKSNDVKNNSNENNKESWTTYLNNKNIIVKKSVWNSQKEECKFNDISLSTQDIKNIINELSKANITKHYYGDFPPTSSICSNRFTLEYENNKISLENDGYVWINDSVLSNKLDLDVDNTTYADNYKEDNYVYKFDINFENIIK